MYKENSDKSTFGSLIKNIIAYFDGTNIMNLLHFIENLIDKKYILLFCFFLCVLFQSFTIPPFQSPDEVGHFTKAYSTLHFDAPSSSVSVYKTLADYMNEYFKFAGNSNHKLTNEIEAKVNHLKWDKGQGKTSVGNPASSYLPLVYIPSAIGIWIGKVTKCTIHTTYHITRIANMIFSLVILLYAFYLVSPNLLTLLILFTPMTLFQYASTSPDCISFSLVVLIFSIVIKIKNSEVLSNLYFWILCLSLCALIGHRLNFLPVIFLPTALYLYKHNTRKAFSSIFIVVLPIIFWILLCKIYLGDATQTRSGLPSSEIIHFYISHPLKIAEVLYKTFTNDFILRYYRNSLIGNLGWLDYSISESVIVTLAILLMVSFMLFIKLRCYSKFDIFVIVLIIMSFFMIFGALLIQWTSFPNPEYIEGVQGRYFIPIILSMAYLMSDIERRNRYVRITSAIILVSYISCSNYSMMYATIHRYLIE